MNNQKGGRGGGGKGAYHKQFEARKAVGRIRNARINDQNKALGCRSKKCGKRHGERGNFNDGRKGW